MANHPHSSLVSFRLARHISVSLILLGNLKVSVSIHHYLLSFITSTTSSKQQQSPHSIPASC